MNHATTDPKPQPAPHSIPEAIGSAPQHKTDETAARQVAEAQLRSELTAEERARFARDGFLHLPGYYGARLTAAIRAWVHAMQQWPETPGRWMQYFESTPACERQLCRLENFLYEHTGFHDLLTHPSLLSILAQLMGEPAVLFKEKINFKLPGGKGFAAHQDAPAFVTFDQRYHITAMIGVDASTPENGCLEIVPGLSLACLLPQAPDGTIAPEAEAQLAFEPIITRPGDLLLFDSFVPHRSAENRSASPRRALYVTYNRASEGNRRLDYFRDKRENFPPECERIPGRDYSRGSRVYNLANPIRN